MVQNDLQEANSQSIDEKKIVYLKYHCFLFKTFREKWHMAVIVSEGT